jgi:hypothetical protein
MIAIVVDLIIFSIVVLLRNAQVNLIRSALGKSDQGCTSRSDRSALVDDGKTGRSHQDCTNKSVSIEVVHLTQKNSRQECTSR